ncbi:hypothetical protein [Desulfocurvus sp.]|uniref:hypothetical protein n=1 Tax=Desulfocurvus sp. TaxID=2871698 RepID=UPI0025C657B8|nr:hypothetical protein [Desulfocurvus sp.]MCK9240816.1 hypothetical protein [Desulfocurvus sp.]
MEIVTANRVDMSSFGLETECSVYIAHIVVRNIAELAQVMISEISDTSWMNKLDAIEKRAFEATSRRTIEELTSNVFGKYEDDVTTDFGEYIISMAAQNALVVSCNHIKLPLAELIKEKVKGNPGFDFHTETTINNVAFGEAKYSGSKTTYGIALEQINRFIRLGKDDAELVTLRPFLSRPACINCERGHKSYVAAFSLNSENPQAALGNCIKSKHFMSLLDNPELFMIGVEIHD